MAEPGHENMVPDFAKDIDVTDLSTIAFDIDKYVQFSPDAATVVFAYSSAQMGVVVWNLAPGQENDYHVHPQIEHLHIILQGECEYSIADRDPIILGKGQAIMVPAQVPHGIRNVGTEPASYMAVTPDPSKYEKIVVDRPDTKAAS